MVEVPIEFVERVRGESKMRRAVARESLRRITGWGLRQRRRPAARRTLEQTRQRHGRVREEQEMRQRRRWVPWWVLALAFVLVPVLEIYVLIQVGQVIGAWWTVLLLVADGALGAWLMKREGGRACARCARRSTSTGCPPRSSPTAR